MTRMTPENEFLKTVFILHNTCAKKKGLYSLLLLKNAYI
ncbi:hypothetical protein BH10BAC2_BH10BAC2_23370 [soil metagenome]